MATNGDMTSEHIKAARDYMKQSRPPEPWYLGPFHPNDPMVAYLKSLGATEAPTESVESLGRTASEMFGEAVAREDDEDILARFANFDGRIGKVPNGD